MRLIALRELVVNLAVGLSAVDRLHVYYRTINLGHRAQERGPPTE